MFCVIYRFEVLPGKEAAFEESWAALTDLIYHHRGSLGSRLHLESERVYLAYAQWPSRDVWASDVALPPESKAHRDRMRGACAKVETIHELQMVDDRLASETYSA